MIFLYPSIQINQQYLKEHSYIIDFNQLKGDTSLYLTSSIEWERELGEMIYKSTDVNHLIYQMKAQLKDSHYIAIDNLLKDYELTIPNCYNTVIYKFLSKKIDEWTDSNKDKIYGLTVQTGIQAIQDLMHVSLQYYISINLIEKYKMRTSFQDINIEITANGFFIPSIQISFN